MFYHWRGTIQWWPLKVVKRCRCSNIVSCALHWILRTRNCIQLNDYYCYTNPAVVGIRTRLRSAIRHRPHHCRSVVHGCRVSATELFRSPLPAPGTTCRATSRPHHLCLFYEAVWRRTSSGVLFRISCSVSAKWLLSLLTLQSFFLLTFLLTYVLFSRRVV